MKINVKVPATTANLGPGFDALGLALNLWNEAEFSAADDGRMDVSISGEGMGTLPEDESNCIVESALQIYEMAGVQCKGLHVDCINRIPIGSGLGSSSAAMLTGMLGANALLGEPFRQDQILKLAIEEEGHPDNVAPAMLGGLVASIVFEDRVVYLKLPARANHGPIHMTVVWPEFDFPTIEARRILPEQVNRRDAVHNISRAVLVTEALRTGDMDLLGKSMADVLHQPYRIPLIPGAKQAMDAARTEGADAVAFSGAGPSLIAFSSRKQTNIGEAMSREFNKAGLVSKIYHLQVSYEGAEVTII
ncbi:MAG: homoserine kinase [Anaerolineales bacterium]